MWNFTVIMLFIFALIMFLSGILKDVINPYSSEYVRPISFGFCIMFLAVGTELAILKSSYYTDTLYITIFAIYSVLLYLVVKKTWPKPN